ISDSYFVNAVSRSHYGMLLESGIEIYLYRKGFVHAKTMVCDGELAVVGSANLDSRSFELNFEVNALVYDKELAVKLQEVFFEDLKDSEKLDKESWQRRSLFQRVGGKALRL